VRRALLTMTVLLIACRAPEPDQAAPNASTEPSGTTVSVSSDREAITNTHATAPAESVTQEISVTSVSATNPLVVKGLARTFENSVSVRVRDAGGAIITERHVTSVGESGNHNPYEAQLWLVRDPGPRLTVEAFEYSAKDGSVRSLTTRPMDHALAPVDVILMFPAGDCDQLKAFTRRVPKSQAMARLLLEALLAGPSAEEKRAGASSPFPAGSEIRSVLLRDGQLTVDFNERLQNVGGSCAATAIQEAVTQTLRRLPTIKRVVITAGGREDLALQP
jgi:hypothetical protein